MYCSECGQNLEKDSAFCDNCGHKNEDINSYESATQEENVNQENLIRNRIFYSSKEKLIDTLGSGYISTLFVQKAFQKSILFCSDIRVYQKGRLFERNHLGKITYYHGEKSVDIKEIQGVRYFIENPISRLMRVALLFLLGILGLIVASEMRGDLQIIIRAISVIWIISSIIALIIYSLKKGKWLILEYAGGTIMTNCNWYSNKSIKRFMRNIALQKDKIIEQTTKR